MLEVEPAWKSSLQQSLGCATWTTVKERRGLVVGCCGELSELTPGLIGDSCCMRMRHPLDATAPRRVHRASIENTSLVSSAPHARGPRCCRSSDPGVCPQPVSH